VLSLHEMGRSERPQVGYTVDLVSLLAEGPHFENIHFGRWDTRPIDNRDESKMGHSETLQPDFVSLR